ncbi:MAG: RNase adapter RapZ [Oscillospiraceae bacterium]|nr:RNase adapter RapZ [Oscillospiraceae bacterium]
MRVTIVTGMSGAGKSQAIKMLEDLGYFCVDNLPPSLLPVFCEMCEESRKELVALVIDARSGGFLKDFMPGLDKLREKGVPYELVFLEARDEELTRRYKELRRSHPLSPGSGVMAGITKERALLRGIKEQAHKVIDTSELTLRQLREAIISMFGGVGTDGGFPINVVSFGFKYGIPIDCDLLFDVRFIPNPFYVPELRDLSGQGGAVRDYVISNAVTAEFLRMLTEMLGFLIPRYKDEGKPILVIGIGCTGGRHRSVAIGDELNRVLGVGGHRSSVVHRDIDKGGQPSE